MSLNLLGWASYLIFQWRGHTNTNPVNWILSFMTISVVGVFFWMQTHDISLAMTYISSLIPVAGVIFLSLRKAWVFKPYDGVLFMLAAVAWASIFLKPEWVSWILCILYVTTTTVFAYKITRNQSLEHPLPWLIWTGSGVAQLIALSDRQAPTESQSIAWVLLFSWALIFLLSYAKSRRHFA